MGSLFGKPKAPKPQTKVQAQAPVNPQSEADKAEAARKAADEESRRNRAGLASNIIYGGAPAATGTPNDQKKLLGS